MMWIIGNMGIIITRKAMQHRQLADIIIRTIMIH